MSGSALVETGELVYLSVVANRPVPYGFCNYFDPKSGKMYWDYDGAHLMSLDQFGNLIVLGTVSANLFTEEAAPLPTSPPVSGGYWMDGGVLAFSFGPAYLNSLPTTEPAQPGVFWLNGGVVCRT